jgi:hypothetical protein
MPYAFEIERLAGEKLGQARPGKLHHRPFGKAKPVIVLAPVLRHGPRAALASGPLELLSEEAAEQGQHQGERQEHQLR